MRNVVRLDPQVLEREKMLEDISDDIDFSFHSIDNGESVKFVKQKKTGLYLHSGIINIVVGFEGWRGEQAG